MSFLELFLLALGLSMDAFAVSISKGMLIKKNIFKSGFIIASYFGFFQAFMPFLGYFLAKGFSQYIARYDHWVAFILLFIIGINMIIESFDNDDSFDNSTSFKSMIILAIATSIDALAVGITLAFLNVNLIFSISIIGIVTFIISFIGVRIGNIFKNKLGSKASFIGGIILIFIGIKILLEHLVF